MQKKAKPIGKSHVAQCPRERNEMVIVDPDRVPFIEQLGKPAGERPVDPEETGGVLGRIFGEIEPVVTDRPKRPVGEAVIKLFEIAAAEVGDRVAHRTICTKRGGGFRHVVGLAGPAEPEAATRLEGRVESDR